MSIAYRIQIQGLPNPAALKVSMFLITSKCFYCKFKSKEIQNYNRKVFLCLPQNYVETEPTLSTTVFQNKFNLCLIKLNVSILKTTFTPCKQYLFGPLIFKNSEKIHADQIILPIFFILSEKKRLINIESSSCKKAFPKCVCYW